MAETPSTNKENRINGYLFIYNSSEMPDFKDDKPFDNMPAIDFYTIFKEYFGDIKENGNHKDIIRTDFRIYFGWHDKPINTLEIQYAGKQALIEIINLGREKNWIVASPYGKNCMHLINLLSLEKKGFKDLDDFLERGFEVDP